MPNSPIESSKEIVRVASALRVFVHGKPQSVRHAAHNIIAGFRTVIAGRAVPNTYRMISEHVKELGGE